MKHREIAIWGTIAALLVAVVLMTVSRGESQEAHGSGVIAVVHDDYDLVGTTARTCVFEAVVPGGLIVPAGAVQLRAQGMLQTAGPAGLILEVEHSGVSASGAPLTYTTLLANVGLPGLGADPGGVGPYVGPFLVELEVQDRGDALWGELHPSGQRPPGTLQLMVGRIEIGGGWNGPDTVPARLYHRGTNIDMGQDSTLRLCATWSDPGGRLTRRGVRVSWVR